MIYATPGTVSYGTLRNEDLLSSFSDELEFLVQQNAEEWVGKPGRRDMYLALVGEAREVNPASEEAHYLIDELCDCLNDFAPPGHYFGTHPGDGADFGFWPDVDFEEEKE